MTVEDLGGKLAIVTGASRGIGFHIAQALHRAGATVAITGREQHTIEAAASKIGKGVHPYVCDHSEAASIDAFAESVKQTLAAPDILVNNAGVMWFGPVLGMEPHEWNEVIDTNLTGVFLTTKAFLRDMIGKERGDIFIISSMSGKKGDAGASAYAASKFGLQGFAQALQYEVREFNIRVMVLNPSSVNTGEDDGRTEGKGIYLHAADLASTVVHLACLPGRTLIRDMDIWGTNPKA